jgi:hypothetical protein
MLYFSAPAAQEKIPNKSIPRLPPQKTKRLKAIQTRFLFSDRGLAGGGRAVWGFAGNEGWKLPGGTETHRTVARYAYPPDENAELHTSFCSLRDDLLTFGPRQPVQPEPNILVTGYPCPQG